MLQFPLKRGKRSVYLEGKLKGYLKDQAKRNKNLFQRVFGADTSKKHWTAVEEYVKLRQEVIRIQTGSKETLKTLTKYYAQLIELKKRFPVNRHGADSKTSTLSIPFTWRNAFNTREILYSSRIEFEMSSVLFNIAATYSQIACDLASEDTSSKEAAKLFQIAAGVLEAVEKVPDRGGSARDLSSETLIALQGMMLASAQTLFYLKAKAAGMKPKTLASVAKGGNELFQKILPAVRSRFPKVWSKQVEFQALCFDATAAWWQSKVDAENVEKTGLGFGVQIARLKVAEGNVLKAEAHAKQHRLPSDIRAQATDLIKAIQKDLRKAVDTNNGVYMDPIPSASELSKITGRVLVKSTPYNVDAETESQDKVFSAIIPNVVTDTIRTFDDRVEKSVAKAKADAKEASDTAHATLASLGLPAAVDDAENSGEDNLPETLWTRITAFRDAGGLRGLTARLDVTRGRRATLMRRLEACRVKLDRERTEDEQYRSRYGSKWHRIQSDRLVNAFLAEIAQYKKTIEKADVSDKRVRERLVGAKEIGRLETGTRSEFDAMMPKTGGGGSEGDDSSALSVLKRRLVEIGTLLRRRDELIQGMDKALAAENDALDKEFVSTLLGATKNFNIEDEKVEALIEAETKKRFGALQAELEINIKKQDTTIQAVVDANEAWSSSRGKAGGERTAVIGTLLQMLEDARRLESDVRSGEQFYDSLESHVGRLEQVVADHCSARNVEATDMTKQIGNGPKYDDQFDAAATKKVDVREDVVPPQFAASMAQLQMMGFSDVGKNLDALRATNGDVKGAVAKLVGS